MKKFLIVGVLIMWAIATNAQNIVVNEFLSVNESSIVDEDGELSDWVELYNDGSGTVNLNGWHLSDNEDDPTKWTFPNVSMSPGEHLLVFASSKDKTNDELHTNFSIKSTGEPIFITDEDGTVVDFAPAQALTANQSFGRETDGDDEFVIFSQASPGTDNLAGLVLEILDNVVINEFMSKNEDVIEDQDEEYSDWIELYNPTNSSIDLGGYYLSDDADSLMKWTFPSVVLGADEFLLVFASGKDMTDGELHTNFSIKSGGEDLILSTPDGSMLDFVGEQELLTDQSYGRLTDGGNAWSHFTVSTPGTSNDGSILEYSLVFSQAPGQYQEAFELDIFSPNGVDIYYTTDGSEPKSNDNLYNGGISIESREGDPNVYSEIPTGASSFNAFPTEEVYKINVIRARAYENGVPVSRIYTRSYMIDSDPDRYTLPIISLVSDPDNFFDDEIGIYVPGSGYNGGDETTMNCFQKGSEWERPVHIEFMNQEEGTYLTQDAGVRIHGGGSRRYAQKPLRLYARSEYGESYFNHNFFPEKDIDEYKRLVLRAQRPSNSSFFTDEVASNLVSELDMERMAVKTHVVFLNGEFWGIYHLRERIDEYFIEANSGADKDNLTIIENNPIAACCVEGVNTEYLEMVDFIEDNDMSSTSNYNQVKEMMDVDNFMEYLAAEFYMCNYDWPRNNLRYWKENVEGSKWRWIFFDLDFGFRFYERPSINNYMNSATDNAAEWSTFLGRKLMENNEFKNDFIDLIEERLNNEYSPENVGCNMNYFFDIMSPHMDEYNNRFDYGANYDYWEWHVEMAKNFAALRPCYIQEQIEDEYGITIDIPDCVENSLDDYDVVCSLTSFETGLELDVKVYLEGPYMTDAFKMQDYLNDENLIPNTQPYDTAPWNYNGNESTETLPEESVDWVLVEMRSGTPNLSGSAGTDVEETKAGILLRNGHIVDPSTGDELVFDDLEEGDLYHIVVRHRNHLDIISSQAIEAKKEMTYNFTLTASSAFGTNQLKPTGDGRFAMYAGDYVADGVILVTDYDAWKESPAQLNVYTNTDGTLDGVVQNTDNNLWQPNKAKIGSVEIQY